MALSDRVAQIKGKDITVSTWLNRYWKIQEERLSTGDIKPNTFKQKRKPVELLRQKFAIKYLPEVDARDIASLLDEYTDAGQPRMGQVVRSVLTMYSKRLSMSVKFLLATIPHSQQNNRAGRLPGSV